MSIRDKTQELEFLRDKIKAGRGNGLSKGDPNLPRYLERAKQLSEEIRESRKRPMFRKATLSSVRSQLRSKVGRANATKLKK